MKKRIITREISFEGNSALKYLEEEAVSDDIDYYNQQHKHDNYLIIFVIKGKVKGFVGSSLKEYRSGDIVVIGRNVPHYFILNEETNAEGKEINEIEILYFQQHLFPARMTDIAELHFIQSLLRRSQQGILLQDKTMFVKIRKMLYRIDDVEGIQKLIELYQILDTLGQATDYAIISDEVYNSENTVTTNLSTLQRIYKYLYTNFHQEITLTELSKHAHQNPTALCRTFKRETGKTIFQFLNKIRIENACKLLIDTDMSISQIAYNSGFNNLPYFNRQFKLWTHQTPSTYKESIK